MPRQPTTVLLLVLMLTTFALSACNTAKGFGEDLSNLGNTITGQAEKHTDK